MSILKQEIYQCSGKWREGGNLCEDRADTDFCGHANNGDVHILLFGGLYSIHDIARVTCRQSRKEDQHLRGQQAPCQIVKHRTSHSLMNSLPNTPLRALEKTALESISQELEQQERALTSLCPYGGMDLRDSMARFMAFWRLASPPASSAPCSLAMCASCSHGARSCGIMPSRVVACTLAYAYRHGN